MKKLLILTVLLSLLYACSTNIPEKTTETSPDMSKKVEQFAEFPLTSNIDDLSENQKAMLPILFEVADIMDNLFWKQAYGNKDEALALTSDSASRDFIKINYGPWERLDGNSSFIPEIKAKPKGAKFYPADMTEAEFDSLKNEDKTSLYSIVVRDEKGELQVITYHEAYKEELTKASELLLQAAKLAEDPGFKKYLELRAKALLDSDYLESDLAWMDMKTNRIDFVVGPIENYEDQLYGYKTAFESYILLKDLEWTKKLERFASLLPELQKQLPVEAKYKMEVPGSESDLGAYDVVYYAGDCNAGSKTIAINLPNDPEVHKQKGSRRLQLKNAMQAKFDKILTPITLELINPEQHKYVTFNAFFENTMFHEVAHGLGVHHTIEDGVTIRKALKDKASALEEGKADILGLFMIDQLVDMGELNNDTRNNYVTFTAGLFRSIRFGASSAHGIANLVRFNYFKELDAFTRDEEGIYTVDFEQMKIAVDKLANEILVIQGNGDYEAAVAMVNKYGVVSDELKEDLDKINRKEIPVDIVFKQGPEQLGL